MVFRLSRVQVWAWTQTEAAASAATIMANFFNIESPLKGLSRRALYPRRLSSEELRFYFARQFTLLLLFGSGGLNDDLAVDPWMIFADVGVRAGLIEFDDADIERLQ